MASGFLYWLKGTPHTFTCIPALRKLTDTDDDGVADTMNNIVEGFGVRVSFIDTIYTELLGVRMVVFIFQSRVTVATMWRPRTEKSMKHPVEGRFPL